MTEVAKQNEEKWVGCKDGGKEDWRDGRQGSGGGENGDKHKQEMEVCQAEEFEKEDTAYDGKDI